MHTCKYVDVNIFSVNSGQQPHYAPADMRPYYFCHLKYFPSFSDYAPADMRVI